MHRWMTNFIFIASVRERGRDFCLSWRVPITIHCTHIAVGIIAISLHDAAPIPRLSRPAVPWFETVGKQQPLLSTARHRPSSFSFRVTEIKYMSHVGSTGLYFGFSNLLDNIGRIRYTAPYIPKPQRYAVLTCAFLFILGYYSKPSIIRIETWKMLFRVESYFKWHKEFRNARWINCLLRQNFTVSSKNT